MANKSDYKYSVYNSLRKKLKEDGVFAEGVVANILLETFLERKGVLKASHVYGKKSKSGRLLIGDEAGITFKQWRKNLEDLGWIQYDEDFAQRTKRYSDHQPGYKLKDYLNKEKSKVAELATMDDIRDLQSEKADRIEVSEKLNELQARVDALEKNLGDAKEEIESSKGLVIKAIKAVRKAARRMLGPNATEQEVERLTDELLNDEEQEVRTLLAN